MPIDARVEQCRPTAAVVVAALVYICAIYASAYEAAQMHFKERIFKPGQLRYIDVPIVTSANKRAWSVLASSIYMAHCACCTFIHIAALPP